MYARLMDTSNGEEFHQLQVENIFSLLSSCLSLSRLKAVLRHLNTSAFSAMAAEDEVLFEKIRNKGIIILNRPKALNALGLPMIRKIYPKMQEWENDPGIALVIMKGAGDKAFCAGGDIRAITESAKRGDKVSQEFFREEYILNNKIGTYKKPFIAVIDGITMGGGVGLSVHGRFRVATDRTLFAMPETAIGLFPDVGGGHFLPRLSGKLGIFLALTGFRLKGQDVQKASIATHYLDSNKLGELEQALLNVPHPDEASITQVLDDFHKQSTKADDKEFVLKNQLSDIDRLFSGATVEEIFQHLEKDGSDWAIKQLNILRKMSPTSMKITLRQLQMGASMTLQQILNIEYRLSQRCVEDHDFHEGVRAVLVDKDQSPKWKPSTLEGVTQEKVDWYFSPLPPDRELIL